MDKEGTPLKQIRTFQGDVAEALAKQQESLVSIQRAEKLKTESVAHVETSEESKKRKQFLYLLLGSLILIAMGAFGARFAYVEFIRKTSPPTIALPENRFITANTEASISFTSPTRDSLINGITSATLNTPRGELKHVIIKKSSEGKEEILSTKEFLSAMESRAPGNLVRALEPLFMLGALGDSTFAIFKLSSFENTFAGMLTWEKNLAEDIGPIFNTAELLRSLPPESTFSDVTDRNKDIRALMFGDQSILLYSFLDSNTLIITDNLDTLRTLIDRLTQEKLSR